MPEVDPAAQPVKQDERERARRRRDIWQLHLPLAFALILCTTLTIVEVRRAGEGVWRAWAYSFEWPMIGVVCIWIWFRYRKQGSITKSLATRWRARVARIEEEFNAAQDGAITEEPLAEPKDPQLQQWQDYLDELHRNDPPGRPPER